MIALSYNLEYACRMYTFIIFSDNCASLNINFIHIEALIKGMTTCP